MWIDYPNFTGESRTEGAESRVKVRPWQCPSSAPAPPLGTPGGSGRRSLPGAGVSPLGAQPLLLGLDLAASKAADLTAFDGPGAESIVELTNKRLLPLTFKSDRNINCITNCFKRVGFKRLLKGTSCASHTYPYPYPYPYP